MVADQRYNKPALHALIDRFAFERKRPIDYSNVELVSVETNELIEYTLQDMLDETREFTRVHLNIRNRPEEAFTAITLSYRRLVLPTFLYREALAQRDPTVPTILEDYLPTTQATVEADALAYLASEYGVLLDPSECEVQSYPLETHLDGTWQVTITPNPDHLVWVGSVVLRAQTA